jgi:putative ABC transport system permease protein
LAFKFELTQLALIWNIQAKSLLMFRNYFIIAVRNIMRSKAYSLINILGLSLGISCCLLLALYIQDEYSYDRHHERLDDLYRISTHFESDRGIDKLKSTSPPVAMTVWAEVPEVEYALRLLSPPGVDRNLIKYEDNFFYETGGFIADSTLFDVLTYELTKGNPKKALVNANSVVISEALAKKLFGSEEASDKMITITQGGSTGTYKVTGVFKNDKKSHIQANFFTSMTSSGWGEYLRTDPEAANEWGGQNFVPAYLKLVPGHNREEVVRKINGVLVKHGAEDMKALGMKKSLGLEAVKDIYLKSDIGQSPRIIYLRVIGSIAVFILLIACINFMNLSTARATKRAAEIGIRKVMGAFRSSLIRQILGEAMVIVALSIVVSIVIVQLALPLFNNLTGKVITFGTENILYFGIALAGITVVTGLVAGSYPAFYLSSFQPAQVLKGKTMLGNASRWLRRSLVVFQFMIAIILACGMFVISKQLDYMQNKSLGFNASAKVIIPLRTSDAKRQYEALKTELLRKNNAQSVSAADYTPGNTIWSDMMFYSEGGNMEKAVLHRRNRIDAGYMEMLGIKLIAGRAFTNNRSMESQNKLIVNRASVKKLGYTPEKIVGEHLYFEWQGQHHSYEVIGVMEDYHQNSLKEEINPIIFEIARDSSRYSNLVAQVDTGHFSEALSGIEQTWKALVNDTPFEFSFLDQNIQKQYDEDRLMSRVISSFTLIAMLISCLGLYGLSSYMAERRFKEIGIRKVMGASVNQIVALMSKEFIRLVIVALVLSVPLAWYGMERWLEGFAYRVPVDAIIFVYAGGLALLIALATVSFESIKAAVTNPVESLRNE